MTAETRRERGRAPGSGAAEDLALLARVAEGDRDAFRELYRIYYPRLLGYLRRMTGRLQLAEEVLDDVMIVVWRQAARFEGRSRVSTWILGIAYRQALRAVRREHRRRAVEEELQPETLVAPESPERDSRQRERAARLGRALRELSPRHRAVVELTYFHGLSYPEIARVVGCPVGTVKTRMFHARRRLRSLLPELEADSSAAGG